MSVRGQTPLCGVAFNLWVGSLYGHTDGSVNQTITSLYVASYLLISPSFPETSTNIAVGTCMKRGRGREDCLAAHVAKFFTLSYSPTARTYAA